MCALNCSAHTALTALTGHTPHRPQRFVPPHCSIACSPPSLLCHCPHLVPLPLVRVIIFRGFQCVPKPPPPPPPLTAPTALSALSTHCPHCSPPSALGSSCVSLYAVFRGFQCVPKPPPPTPPPPPSALCPPHCSIARRLHSSAIVPTWFLCPWFGL